MSSEVNPLPQQSTNNGDDKPREPNLPAPAISGYMHDYDMYDTNSPSTPDPAFPDPATGSKVDGGQRMTPVTSRPSKAMKGRPVHICELCSPPKVRPLLCARGTTGWI